MSHPNPMHLPVCPMPKITRYWRRLGPGATWSCFCGIQHRLEHVGDSAGSWWSWRELGPRPQDTA